MATLPAGGERCLAGAELDTTPKSELTPFENKSVISRIPESEPGGLSTTSSYGLLLVVSMAATQRRFPGTDSALIYSFSTVEGIEFDHTSREDGSAPDGASFSIWRSQ